MVVDLDNGVPIPRARGGAKSGKGKAKYPWRSMSVGDSFFVEASGRVAITQNNLCACANQSLGAGNYTTRVEDSGVRIWRIA